MESAIIPIALLVAAFYLLVLRPAQLRSRRAADIKEHLKPGVEILTTAGIFGRVDRVTDDEMYLEVAPGVVVKLVTAAVGKILTPKDEPADGAPGSGPGSAPDTAALDAPGDSADGDTPGTKKL